MKKEKYLHPESGFLEFEKLQIICVSAELDSSLSDYDEYDFEW